VTEKNAVKYCTYLSGGEVICEEVVSEKVVGEEVQAKNIKL